MGDILQILSAAGTVCAIIFGLTALFRTKKTDASSEGRQDGQVLTELGYIKGGIDDVKTEQREQRKTNTEFVTRLTAVEASAKQAHKRLDQIEFGHVQERRE